MGNNVEAVIMKVFKNVVLITVNMITYFISCYSGKCHIYYDYYVNMLWRKMFILRTILRHNVINNVVNNFRSTL